MTETEIQTDEKDRWISVDVRTPATADFVIATNMRAITLAQYFQGNWIGMSCVTHWMALPNMPIAASREES